LAKIAVDLNRALVQRDLNGTPGAAAPRIVARGDGWTVADVVCTSGPADRVFEEQHSDYAIAVVVAGTFQYRSTTGGGMMTPGALMLGNPGQCYECGHEHGRGDRCVAFWYAPDYFERLAAEVSARRTVPRLLGARLPPLRELAPFVSRAAAGVSGVGSMAWEELAVGLAGQAVRLAAGTGNADAALPAGGWARITDAVRAIDRHPASPLSLEALARRARLSPYHFLRSFQRATGVTPHQYVLRARLRDAAWRLTEAPGKVVDVALDCGFGDVSNFTRAFRAEFGVTPRGWRGLSPVASHSP
jgi:AraC family transcriptional regulator